MLNLRQILQRFPRKAVKISLIVTGVLLAFFPQLYRRVDSAPVISVTTPGISPAPSPAPSLPEVAGPIRIDPGLLSPVDPPQPPVRILIPGINIDLPVVEAKVINGYWELSETSASHGVGSANPGQSGNTVIFAHAREGLFVSLRNIKTGDRIYLLTSGRWYRYSVDTTKLVSPDQTEVISPATDEILTLFTCSGFLDSKRLIVRAKPVRL